MSRAEPVANLTIRFDASPGYPEASLQQWIDHVEAALRAYSMQGHPPPQYADFKVIDARLIASKRG